MSLESSEISAIIKKQIGSFKTDFSLKNQGTLLSVQDGIVRIHGLEQVMQGEMVQFENGLYALALNLEREAVGAVVLGPCSDLHEGMKVSSTGSILQVPVGKELLGRVINPLGLPVDGLGSLQSNQTFPMERVAPGVMTRQGVSVPLHTGVKVIDAMVPIGRGQRELIIGDRQTGKTTLAFDSILNQKKTGVFCIYVAIGQKESTVANFVQRLREHDALKYTIIVNAPAAAPAAMQYLAPYAGCAMGEYFRDRGQDALIVYDDLTKHAWAYRQLSLLLRRPPGREAYPGDVFYLHSRLLERAACVNSAYVEEFTKGAVKGRSGSLTALPIIETQAGDISAFVPTNVISITDGQIFLQSKLFHSNIRPAINVGVSVSRVGGAAQTKIIKKLSAGIRLSLAQYRELESFSQFASDLDKTTQRQLDRGVRMTEIMKQKPYAPHSTIEMALSLYAADKGYLDNVPVAKISKFEENLHRFARENERDFSDQINESGEYSEEIASKLESIVRNFHQQWQEI